MKTKIAIEKGIPIPEPIGHTSIYPFAEMEVGDSFVAPVGRGRAAASAHYWGKKLNRRFTCRIIDRNSTRIWRIS